MNVSKLVFPAFLCGVLVGCGTPKVQNETGQAPISVDPSKRGPVSGIGIEAHDIVSMTDKMLRDMLANPTLAGRATPPRIILDSQQFKNTGSQPINRDLMTQRLRVNLNQASQGRLSFVTNQNVDMVQKARELKREGVTDIGTTGLTKVIAGADFQLTGNISSLDSSSVKTGLMQRYNQIIFEMTDLESGVIVWSGIYEFERAAADDVVYR